MKLNTTVKLRRPLPVREPRAVYGDYRNRDGPLIYHKRDGPHWYWFIGCVEKRTLNIGDTGPPFRNLNR